MAVVEKFRVEHRTWSNMKSRCNNSNLENYSNYGGRGITVCDQWENNFEQFYRDMGPRPEGDYSIDRIDNDGNYEPSNCRWACQQGQAENKRSCRSVKVCGINYPTVKKACREHGASYSAVMKRIHNEDIDPEQAILMVVSPAINPKQAVMYRGKRYPSLASAAREHGISHHTVKRRGMLL